MKTLRKYRFELYLGTFCLLLFGSLFFPVSLFESHIEPLFILLNIASGFILVSVRKKTRPLYWAAFAVLLAFEVIRHWQHLDSLPEIKMVRYGLFTLFYTLLTLEIILQVWEAQEVNKNVIFGVMGGYVSLGLVSFFMLLGIYLLEPEAYRGLEHLTREQVSDQLLYYTYITLMTIGYGDIVPVKPLAQKAAVLIGLWGQFYLVIITAVVVSKYVARRQGSR